MNRFDIAPFALPNHPANELRFEEVRDVEEVEVVFAVPAPETCRLQYMRKVWPQNRFEHPGNLDLVRPFSFGWSPIDDTFTPEWVDAAVEVEQVEAHTLRFRFKPLRNEIPDFPGAESYNVTFRRTLGLRVLGSEEQVSTLRVFTRSLPVQSSLRIELDAGNHTPSQQFEVCGYNAVVKGVTGVPEIISSNGKMAFNVEQDGTFGLDIAYMLPTHRYAHDDGQILFNMGHESAPVKQQAAPEKRLAFTISLTSLEDEGPVWFADAGIYITRAEDPESFEQYQARIKGCQTIAQQVASLPEQSLAGAMNGQPRPHPIAYCCGCKHARQKFWIEPWGDIVLNEWMLQRQPGADTPRWKNQGDARIFFGLEGWAPLGRHNDPWPVMAYNQHFRRGGISVQQKCFAVPLMQSILAGEPAADDTIVGLVRFRFENTGDEPAKAQLPVAYSSRAGRSYNRRDDLVRIQRSQTDALVPLCEREELSVDGNLLMGTFQGAPVLRMAFETEMAYEITDTGFTFVKELKPGEGCELLLRIPYVSLETLSEIEALAGLDFEHCYTEMVLYWRAECRKGAQIHTPDPHLNAAFAGHLPIVLMSDFSHPDGSGIVNTSVGTATYGNYTNESVMIIEELEQRGLVDEVRRRLGVWTRYQGTVGLIGRFSDYEGVFFGADGLESGHSYNQHHGWALWYLACHYLHTGDREWFAGVVENVLKGAEWITRQRKLTMGELPYSRGWEQGFLPAGALEDVDDFFYWLSTNCLTWRGLDAAAEALERFEHPQAARYRQEAAEFRQDLVRGFETNSQNSPLIRLRDGRWIPHYPSRLYCRGRDYGWIREVLEGSVYLLLSGLYDPQSKEGGWILDDYQDTRYMNPPFGYRIDDPATQWFDCGGFSPQPNLLAGLLPHLDRDEIEIYLWMFFNAWAACYREEVQAMVEHPQPVLGFSNAAPFKTSDQSNAMKWLVYMFVRKRDGLLHLGRALPRAWFAGEERFGAEQVSTPAGTVSIEYVPQPSRDLIEATIDLDLHNPPDRLLVRFRHAERKPILSVNVDDQTHQAFDAQKGDVELDPVSCRVQVVAHY